MMKQKQLMTEHGSIVYWIGGQPDSPLSLVLLHGLTADHTLFDPQVAFFASRYRILCWDAPGHGLSRPYDGSLSCRDAARALKQILDTENIKRPVLIGQSMGGYFSQMFLRLYPDAAAGLAAIDSSPLTGSYYSAMDRWWLRQTGWMTRCIPYRILTESIARSCTTTLLARDMMRTSLLSLSRQELCHLMQAGYAGVLEELKDDCCLPASLKVVLLVGEHDRTGKVRTYCRRWHQQTGYPLHVIKNAAHNSNADNPEQVNRILQRFLQSLV